MGNYKLSAVLFLFAGVAFLAGYFLSRHLASLAASALLFAAGAVSWRTAGKPRVPPS